MDNKLIACQVNCLSESPEAALFEIMTDKDNQKIRTDLDLNSDSSVLLFSTEGDTDPEVYRDIVWG